MRSSIVMLLLLAPALGWSQSKEYTEKKNRLLVETSPFEKIIARSEPRELEYEDSDVVVFKGLRDQALVHLLIVPKRRINTLNEATEEDALLLGKMILVAQQIAKEKGIAETGYRLVFNTNEDSGQSVFHIHLHLLGGMKLGPMVDQTWSTSGEREK